MTSLQLSNRHLLLFCGALLAAFAFGIMAAPAKYAPVPAYVKIPSRLCVSTQNVTAFEPFSEFAGLASSSSSADAEVVVTHLQTPKPLRGIYMTSWVAGIPSWRNKLIAMADRTEINAFVIDVKDYSGHLSFQTGDPVLAQMGVEEPRIRGMRGFLAQCHAHHIYTIARITVFQDPVFSKKYPQLSVQTHAGQLWRDRNGLSYVDPYSKPFWDYIIRIADGCVKAGFDEINFDYIRFPTDGNMRDMVFPISGAVSSAHLASGNASANISVRAHTKGYALQAFFKYLHQNTRSWGIPISADLFGMVLTSHDDLNIGQMLEVALPEFDYICPMIYPSHYPPGFKGYGNPAQYPYEIVRYVLGIGGTRADKMGMKSKLRPWLQDFNLGARYDAAKIIAQKKATYDAGLDSWLMWDPRNRYTPGGYAP